MTEGIRTVTAWMAIVIDGIAALVIALAALIAAWHLLVDRPLSPEPLRLQLGRWLLLGIEFLLAADILRSAASPTWNDLGQLAAVVVIRTVLDYFLQRDIDVSGRQRDPSP